MRVVEIESVYILLVSSFCSLGNTHEIIWYLFSLMGFFHLDNNLQVPAWRSQKVKFSSLWLVAFHCINGQQLFLSIHLLVFLSFSFFYNDLLFMILQSSQFSLFTPLCPGRSTLPQSTSTQYSMSMGPSSYMLFD